MKPNPRLAIFHLDGTELILILTAALLLFSGRKLSQSAKALGQGIKSFKKMTVNTSEEINAK